LARKSAEDSGKAEKTLGREMPEKDIPPEMIDSLRLFVVERRLDIIQVKAIFSEKIAGKIGVQENSVPVEVFRNNRLSALESIVKYLHEEKSYSFARIAAAAGRSSKTIWTTYSKAKKKMPERFSSAEAYPLSHINIPISILKNRRFGVQESIVRYLREESRLSLHKIALMLNRDDRTIWTAYDRTRKKSAKDNEEKF